MSDPKRWLDDPEQSAALRVDLQRAAEALPTYDASAGLAALQRAIQAAPTDAGSSASASVAKGSLLKLKLGLAAGAAAAIVASVAVFTARPAVERPAAARTATKPAPPAPIAAPAPVRMAAHAPEPAPIAVPASVPAPAMRPAPAPMPAPTAREIAQLARIKAAIDADPALALRLAQRGHREFAHGVLRPEREGLLIVALYALDRRAEADARARAYLAAHPKGVLAERVRALNEGSP